MLSDRWMMWGVQAVVVGLPLALGGRQPVAVALATGVVLALLVATLRARRAGDAPAVPGVVALAGFVGLALVTTLPLPPALLGVVAPAAYRLYETVLGGWPGGATGVCGGRSPSSPMPSGAS